MAQNNGYDLCSGLIVGGRPRYLLEGACFYKNDKAMGYLTLVAGCNIDQTWNLKKGKGYTCQSLIFAKRSKAIKKLCGDDKKDATKVAENEQKTEERKSFEKTSKFGSKVFFDQLRL